jgi:hypothetical protein
MVPPNDTVCEAGAGTVVCDSLCVGHVPGMLAGRSAGRGRMRVGGPVGVGTGDGSRARLLSGVRGLDGHE